MRKLVLAVIAGLGLFALVACSSQPKDKSLSVNFDVNEVAQEIMTAGGMTVQNAVDASALNLDEAMVKSFAAFQDSDEGANRVYLFELASADHETAVKYIGEKEQDENINRLVNAGGGDELEVAKASRILVKGNYVLYLSVPNYEEAKAVFTSKFE